MKKILPLIFTAALLLILFGCGNKDALPTGNSGTEPIRNTENVPQTDALAPGTVDPTDSETELQSETATAEEQTPAESTASQTEPATQQTQIPDPTDPVWNKNSTSWG